MADSLTKVGSIYRWEKEPNWVNDITAEYKLSRRLIAYPGTPVILEPVAEETILAVTLKFMCKDKDEEYQFITKFVDFKGRVGRFWMKHPANFFTMKTNSFVGAPGIYCEYNGFGEIYQGYERVFIPMNDGDLVVRKVVGVSETVGSHTFLQFDTILDRDIITGNHLMIGRYLLGRFDSDSLRFVHHSNVVSEVDINFVELVKEYDFAD
jgi:uncharacterized Zn-finger protein